MVFGELVDSVPIFGSQRNAYILIGATLHGQPAWSRSPAPPAAGSTFLTPDQLYILGAMLIVIGTVIQDVVADAMSTEVVARTDAAGKPRPDARGARRARHGAGARPPRAVGRHPGGRRPVRMARRA